MVSSLRVFFTRLASCSSGVAPEAATSGIMLTPVSKPDRPDSPRVGTLGKAGERRGLQRYAGIWSLWALGVGAVISMLSIGAGAEQQALGLIDRMGVRNVLGDGSAYGVRLRFGAWLLDTDLRALRHVIAAEQVGTSVTPRDLAEDLGISTASTSLRLNFNTSTDCFPPEKAMNRFPSCSITCG